FEPASRRAGSSVAGDAVPEAAGDQADDSEAWASRVPEPSNRPEGEGPAEGVMPGRQDSRLPNQPDAFQQSSMRVTSATRDSQGREAPDEDARRQTRQRREDEVKVGTSRPRRPERSESRQPLLEEESVATVAGTEPVYSRQSRSTVPRQSPEPDGMLNDPRPEDRSIRAKAAPISLPDQERQGQHSGPAPFRPGHSFTEVDFVDNRPAGTSLAISTADEETASTRRRMESLGPPSAQSTSTIKVTIGRVEVRAIVSDSKPRRPESIKAKPRITLDEYLKQRNGGQR